VNRPRPGHAKTRVTGAGAFIISLLISLVAAFGHSSKTVKRERIEIGKNQVFLTLRYEVSEPRFTSDLRERFDIDGDRKLSLKEQASLEDYVRLLATEDLHLRWNGVELSHSGALKTSSGMDRELPSAYPLVFYWRLEFPFAGAPNGELVFEDREARWHSSFTCDIDLAPGIKTEPRAPGSLVFAEGRGFFRIVVENR
jgi:hypothetical protein